MTDRQKIINAIEKAKKQSEEYALDRIVVPFKEADMILALLKEQEAELFQQEAELDILRRIYKQENPYKQAVRWE